MHRSDNNLSLTNFTMAFSKVSSTKEPQLTIQSFQQCSSLISIKLTSTNFLLWRSQIIRLIRSLGLYHHIQSDDKPAPTIERDGEKAPNPSYERWLTNDGLLISWLLGTMKEEIMTTTSGSDSAYQLWSTLEVFLLPNTEARLKNMLETCQKGTKSLDIYLINFEYICDSLAAIKQPVSELDKVVNFARGLGVAYELFYRGWLARSPDPSFSKFVLDIQGFEQTRKDKPKVIDEDDDRIDSEDIKFLKRWKESAKTLSGVYDGHARPFSISVVPEELRKWNESAYVPKVVAIGPQYKGTRRGLLPMEEIKLRCVVNLFDRRREMLDLVLDKCMQVILKLDERLRASYVDEIKLDKYELAAIIVYGGCFLLELLISGSEEWNARLPHVHPLKCRSLGIEVGKREEVLSDLILLENQIPFFILHKLSLVLFPRFFVYTEISAPSLLLPSRDSSFKNPHIPAHLLELVHWHIPGKSEIEKQEENQERQHSSSVIVVELNRCATRLQAAGISIKATHTDSEPEQPPDTETRRRVEGTHEENQGGQHSSVTIEAPDTETSRRVEGNHVNDPGVIPSFNFYIKFSNSSGILEIPPLHITHTTEAKWRNFIAWEHHQMTEKSVSVDPGTFGFSCKCTSSALLFNGLICCADDVQLLKDRKVIVDHLNMSNQDLVAFFRSITMGVDRGIIDPSYSKMFDALNTCSATPYATQIPIILRHYLTRIPELICSFRKFLSRGYNFAATLMLVLTLVQAIYAVLSYHHPKK